MKDKLKVAFFVLTMVMGSAFSGFAYELHGTPLTAKEAEEIVGGQTCIRCYENIFDEFVCYDCEDDEPDCVAYYYGGTFACCDTIVGNYPCDHLTIIQDATNGYYRFADGWCVPAQFCPAACSPNNVCVHRPTPSKPWECVAYGTATTTWGLQYCDPIGV